MKTIRFLKNKDDALDCSFKSYGYGDKFVRRYLVLDPELFWFQSGSLVIACTEIDFCCGGITDYYKNCLDSELPNANDPL